MTELDQFRALLESSDPAVRSCITPGRPVTIARAPGRLDVMGGIADYSGSLVLELPIREATFVAAQGSEDGLARVVSLADEDSPTRTAEFPLAELVRLAGGDYAQARSYFRHVPQSAWAAYVVGVFVVLLRERHAAPMAGLRILAHSSVPEAKGVSSSAALEVATMQALASLLAVPLDGFELARLCQMVENHVVGAPCGIMDQMTSALGRTDHLLALRCQPAEVEGFVRLPGNVGVWGIDSGIRHAVSGSDYTSVRTGAFMGYRIVAHLAGLRPTGEGPRGTVQLADPHWQGYLARVSPAEFESRFARLLPDQLLGREFLDRYVGTTDPVTRVDPDRLYAVRHPTAHPIYENERVRRFADLLTRSPGEAALREMGQLMYDSHASYSACGLGSEGTDRLVELIRATGVEAGLYGAKITGGGSGGTVAVLARSDAQPALIHIARRYAAECGRGGYLFAGSSPGACQFGVHTIELAEKQ